ncbi:hypothetical protein DCAR_0933874 [Daucus carota subsp. sativus]|uniref:Uncharacterized protein n=1 Tax=Daucus carota subsp. sativus TaxID=79200 RepID=A0AAF0WVH3_DAUCS|nr:hypothetical protein DCAR_0414993 [Daucus carota subsp. sativus]WOH14355.1 hypothetical protein DCAR_0933874 [Daucus carota subsp. sativus]
MNKYRNNYKKARCENYTNPPYKGKNSFEDSHYIHNHRVIKWGPVMAGPVIVAKPRNSISSG